MKRLAAILATTLAATTLSAEQYYVKTLTFPEGATLEEKVEMASRLVPSEKQTAWQDMELTAFLHFGINTFTDREWGDGTEDPALFNPVGLDTDQWVRTLKEAGFAMAMLTAKHHDGFCLWPTATTSHSVKASPWLDGRGDVVGMLAESCRKYDMKLGLYLSPWDRNAECYGDSPRYNDMFVAQLTELLTRYGTVDEVWFDGACGEGPNGKRQEYDWQRFKETIETLMPGAVVAIMGDDVRWVGNEKGLGRETEWSATPFVPGILPHAAEENARLGLFNKAPDLGSRQLLERADRLYWWPSEVDVSIRPGWFWHEKESPRSLRELADIYVNSVGRNSVLLLNIPPDPRGLIDEADATRLRELREWIDANFPACQTESEPLANCVVLTEDISRGQRVEAFEVQALVDAGRGSEEWIAVATGTTVGRKRILTFPPVEARDFRVNVTSSRGEPNVSITAALNISMPEHEIESLPEGYLYADCGPAMVHGNAIVVDLPEETAIDGFEYVPAENAIAYRYRLYARTSDGRWKEIPVSGEFSNIMHNPLPQRVYFETPVTTDRLRLSCLETTDGSPTPAPSPLRPIKKSK